MNFGVDSEQRTDKMVMSFIEKLSVRVRYNAGRVERVGSSLLHFVLGLASALFVIFCMVQDLRTGGDVCVRVNNERLSWALDCN